MSRMSAFGCVPRTVLTSGSRAGVIVVPRCAPRRGGRRRPPPPGGATSAGGGAAGAPPPPPHAGRRYVGRRGRRDRPVDPRPPVSFAPGGPGGPGGGGFTFGSWCVGDGDVRREGLLGRGAV